MSSGLKGYSKPWGDGTPKWVRDAALNDSDKTVLTVPTGKVAMLKMLAANLANTATVGSRSLCCKITNGTNDIIPGAYAATSAANQKSGLFLLFGAPAPRDTTTALLLFDSASATANTSATYGLPELIIPAGYTVRVYDALAVDAAADDLTVILHYVEYDA